MLDLIIGMASGYTFEDLEPFAVSLSRSGYKGECVLIVGEGPKDEVPRYGPLPKAREDRTLEQMLGRYGIKVWDVGKFDEHPSVARQSFIYTYVHQHMENLRFVICTDVKDVVFQSNPIDWLEKYLPEDQDIVVISENQTYGTGEMVGNNKNMVEAFGEEEYKKLHGKWIVNGGVFAGRALAIRALLLLNYNLCLKDKRRGNGAVIGYAQMLPDQSSLNILVRDELFKGKIMISFPIDGFVFGHPLTRYSTFKDGKMYPMGSQKPYAIFHQYFDKEPWWLAVRSKYRV